MKRKILAAAGVIAVAAGTLTACSGASSGAEASCTNEIVNTDAQQISVWAWYPAFEEVVDLYNNSHDDVQICWSNAGQGNDEYTKFSTAIEAGTGAPDVIMLENEVLSSFIIRESLVDLTGYGVNDVKGDYTEGSWKDVSSGDGVYAVPVDGGPMGLLYRKDIFDEYGISVPTTWDEYAAAAQTLKDAGSTALLGDFPTNGRAFTQALYAQKGSVPYTFDGSDPTNVGVVLNDQAAKDVNAYWFDLIDRGLVATDDAFTTDYNTKLVDGSYATYIAAAWGPGYLSGLADQDADAVWAAAPIPQWDTANPVQVNWGGSSFSVTSQSENPELAAQVAKEIYGTEEAWTIGIEKGALFPQWKPILESDYFRDLAYPFFDGQQINKDVFLDAAAGYEGFTFSPFQNFAYDKTTEELFAAVEGEKSSDAALDDLQSAVVDYATAQGFTVAE